MPCIYSADQIKICSRKGTRNNKVIFQRYRSLQVLNNSFNGSFAELVLTVGTFAIYACEVIFGVGMFKLVYPIVPVSVYLIFPAVRFGTLFMDYLVTHLASKSYRTNCILLQNWDRTYSEKSDNYARIYKKSCQILKIRVGNITTIDRNSVILSMDFIINWTITILLAMEFE